MPESNQKVNDVIADLTSGCPKKMAEAAANAQYVLHGPVTEAPGRRLVENLVRLIELDEKGEPRVPCEHARERAVYAIIIAHEGGHDMSPHLHHIKRAANDDPHPWVRTAANDAIAFHMSHNQFNQPHNLPGPVRSISSDPRRRTVRG